MKILTSMFSFLLVFLLLILVNACHNCKECVKYESNDSIVYDSLAYKLCGDDLKAAEKDPHFKCN